MERGKGTQELLERNAQQLRGLTRCEGWMRGRSREVSDPDGGKSGEEALEQQQEH